MTRRIRGGGREDDINEAIKVYNLAIKSGNEEDKTKTREILESLVPNQEELRQRLSKSMTSSIMDGVMSRMNAAIQPSSVATGEQATISSAQSVQQDELSAGGRILRRRRKSKKLRRRRRPRKSRRRH
jgi:hypothetical protein